jgi:hypothetical protein
MCNILKAHKQKTGAAGQSATLVAHRKYNARPEVIARNQEYRDGEGYAGHVDTVRAFARAR